MHTLQLTGNIVDIYNKEIFYGTISIDEGFIKSIEKLRVEESSGKFKKINPTAPYLLPGFIDAHIHVESSMLVPSEFARLATIHGTTGTVSDPHEIANVCGEQGIMYMIENAKQVPFKFHFGAPSCVPATPFETNGATLDADNVTTLLQHTDIFYLSEVMNYPAVINKETQVIKKIEAACNVQKPIDGHAPELTGTNADAYFSHNISTDHECVTLDEALYKIKLGVKILIREGSAAKNFEALCPLIDQYPNQVMFCSDDKHPDSLAEGHINILCKRAVAKGYDIFNVLQAACINPIQHYNMRNGTLRVGDAADCIVVNNLHDFEVQQTYINGILVAHNGASTIKSTRIKNINNFDCHITYPENFVYKINADFNKNAMQVITAIDGELITPKTEVKPLLSGNTVIADEANDVLKIAVINRYKPGNAPAIAFIKNFGIKSGAIASSVAHDSHNIVVVGTTDEFMSAAANLIINESGGISAVGEHNSKIMALPVAGLMSDADAYYVVKKYMELDNFAKNELQSTLTAPFMTLSFMALLVIPHLKLSDKGLFDVDTFTFTSQ